MDKHKFTISISGAKDEATEKAQGIAVIASLLDAKTITALARVIKTDPSKVALAKGFLGIR